MRRTLSPWQRGRGAKPVEGFLGHETQREGGRVSRWHARCLPTSSAQAFERQDAHGMRPQLQPCRCTESQGIKNDAGTGVVWERSSRLAPEPFDVGETG